ncbi:phosphoribosylamine--glycine ligase [bacterium]|nr:phosphoribosylamine--glycine ligase [bacterium]
MKKTVLVIGGGGREHAICLAFKKSKHVGKIYCAPGNAGIAEIANCVDIKATDCQKIVDFALEIKPDLVFVAPDDPLSLGLVNMLEAKSISTFGPSKEAAIIESSKAFSKAFMLRNNIPTANFATFTSYSDAISYCDITSYPTVIKADGLALGKGVIICQNKEEAIMALKDIMIDKVFGSAGSEVVFEEFLTGKEITLLVFTDGKTVKCMPASQDHKRAYDNDEGKNTGGMGAFAPTPTYTRAIEKEVLEKIVYPTIEGLNKENRTFKGVLYFGLMACKDGVKVIEYNARFGDPETQVVLPMLNTDFYEICIAVIEERLAEVDISWKSGSSLTVVIASGGYPENVIKGYPITIGELSREVALFHSGTAIKDGILVTNGGRVFCLTSIGDSISSAREKVYKEINKIQFSGARYRTDIGI